MGVEFVNPGPVAAPLARMDRLAEQPGPGFGEAMGAAFRTENSVGSWLAQEDRVDAVAPEDYDPYEDIGGYESHAESFMLADTPEDVHRIKRQIDRETEDRRTLQAAGWKGFAAMFAAGAVDPVFLVSLAVPGGGATRLSSAARMAGQGLLGSVAAEGALQATQETRTITESMLNIASSTLLAGVIGAVPTPKAERQVLAQAIERELTMPETSTAGAAARITTTLEQETLAGTAGVARALKPVSPLLRAVQSESRSARIHMQELAENALYMAKNEEGIASPVAVETLVRGYEGRIAAGIEHTRDAFTRYRTGRTGAMTRARLAAQDVLGAGDKLTAREFRGQVTEALRRGDEHVIPEVAEVARWYRKNVFNPIKEEAIAMGRFPEDVKVVGSQTYVTRLYRQDRIAQRRQEFRGILTDWMMREKGVEELIEAQSYADQIINNILGVADGRMPLDVVPVAGPFKERVLDIDDELIKEFLEDDIDVIADRYIRTVSPEIELTKRFGDKEMSQQIQNIVDDYNRLMQVPGADNAKLHKAMERDIEDLTAVRDLILGMYAAPRDAASFAVQAGRRLRDLNFLRMLGGMTISAIPDVARPIMRHGLSRFGRTLFNAITHPQAFNMARGELRKSGIGLDMVLGGRLKSIADLQDVADLSTRVGRYSQAATQVFANATLMNPWNASMKQFSGVMVQDEILRSIRSGTNIRKLAQMGIDSDMGQRILREFDTHGEDLGVLVSHADQWADVEAATVLRAAILKDVDTIIVTPGKADKPLFASNELGKTVFQFKSFAFAATNRVLLSGLQQRDMAALNGALLTLALGGMTYAVKQKLADRPISDDPGVLLGEAFDRSGMAGILMDFNNIAEKVSRGRVGLSALTGGPTMSRYQSRNIIGAIAGPSVDTIEDISRVAGAVATGEWTEGEVYAARKLIPYQNLFYLRNLFNVLEEQAAEELVQ